MLSRDGEWRGFRITGHSGYDSPGNDILCAAISSAAALIANLLTEQLGCKAVTKQRDGYLLFSLTCSAACRARQPLEAFADHIRQLAEQYPKHLRITILEVY